MILIMHKYIEQAKKLEQIFQVNNNIKCVNTYTDLFKAIKNNVKELKAVLFSISSTKTNVCKIIDKINSQLDRKIPIFLITNKYLDRNDQQIFEAFYRGIVYEIEETSPAYLLRAKLKNIMGIYSENEILKNSMENLKEEKLIKLLEVASFSNTKDKERNPKIKNIGKITETILKGLNKRKLCKYSAHEIRLISLASQLYDIGKSFVDDKTGNEYTIEGAKILKKYLTDKEISEYAYNIALLHRERIDGKGKPYGLLGENIPIYSQVVGLADIYNNLSDYSHEEIIEKIKSKEYGEFSKDIIEILEKEGKNLLKVNYKNCI